MKRMISLNKSIALFELFKGVAAIVFACILLLSDKNHPVKMFSRFSYYLNPHSLFLIYELIFIYVTLRFIEAYGLWFEKKWGNTFASVSIAAYIPFEVYEFFSGPTLIKSGVVIFNAALLVYFLKRRNSSKVLFNS